MICANRTSKFCCREQKGKTPRFPTAQESVCEIVKAEPNSGMLYVWTQPMNCGWEWKDFRTGYENFLFTET